MNYHKGFTAVATLLIVLGLIVVGAGGYVAMNPDVLKKDASMDATQNGSGDTNETEETTSYNDGQISIMWKLTAAPEKDGIPYTNVAVAINGTTHAVGSYAGSCSEIGASGGIDGSGLLAGELSAVQCWYAGSGDEIGVFAHEDGGVDILAGELGEGEAGSALFRGNFVGKATLPF